MNRIFLLRREKKLTQMQASMQTGIDQSNLSKLENGERDLSIDTCETLAIFYNTSMDYLMGLTDVREPYPRSKSYQPKYPLD